MKYAAINPQNPESRSLRPSPTDREHPAGACPAVQAVAKRTAKIAMKYTLQYTDALGKCRYFRKPMSRLLLLANLRPLLTKRPKKQTHAVLVTICRSQET